MKAVTYQKSSDTFVIKDLPIPQLETEFDVVVKVYAVGLNPVDAKVNYWSGMVDNMDDDFVGGLDVSGEVIAVGAAVKGWSIGDQVLYHGNMRRHAGGFAEYALQDSRTLLKKPAVTHELAAATPCAAWTAYRALHSKLKITDRNSLFIAGGAGGVGSFAIQLAKLAGIETIITTSSSEKHQFVKALGATHVIDYRTQNVVEEVLRISKGEGVESALDCVGGDNAAICAQVLSYEGEMVELVDTVNPTLYPGAFLRGLSFHQFSLGSGHVNGEQGFTSITSVGMEISKLLECGGLVVPELEVISLKGIPNALKEIRAQRTLGKIVARVF
ncbi:dehydrogenase [Vibrio splendidus]|nr:dehydrogenase [Vibrio splendidus]